MSIDLDLIERAKSGDQEARLAIVRALRPTVAWILKKCFQTKANEDLHQDGALAVLQAVAAFDPAGGAAFKTFARICIYRALKTILRPRRCRPRTVQLQTPELLPAPKAQGANDDESVRRAVACLPPQCRAVIEAHFGLYGKPMKIKEMALRFGISHARARDLVRQAKKKLAAHFDGELAPEPAEPQENVA